MSTQQTSSRMRLHPVNPAEAVIAAFFDPGLSPVEEWTLTPGPGTRGLRKLHHYTTSWGWDAAEPGVPAWRWSWEGDVDLSAYDGFFLQAALPSTATVTLAARIDGRWAEIVSARGCDSNDDYTGPFAGGRLEALRIELVPSRPGAGAFATYYLGVHHERKLADWLEHENPTVYPEDWPEFIKPEAEWGEYAPSLGLSVRAGEMEALRRKMAREPYQSLAEALRSHAREPRPAMPERLIRRYAPCGPQPFAYSARRRDRGMPLWSDMDQCAFFGLVDRDPSLVRMGARYLLSLAHCHAWAEGFVEHDFPGSAMNWRSFFQNMACLAVVNTLDWIGFALTDHAREVVLHDLFFKGLAPLEFDFARYEYIYHMNQAAVFSYGRIAALLALDSAWPRMAGRIEAARKDLDDTAREIIFTDGGYGEGPGYYSAVMYYMLGSYLLLARRLEVQARTLVPAGVLAGADYFGTFVSTTGGAARLALSDGPGTELNADWLAMFARVTGDPRWSGLLASRLESDLGPVLDGQAARVWRGSGVRTLIYGPDDLSRREQIVPRFRIHAASGHATSARAAAGGTVRVHLCGSSAAEGHSHADKGSIVLEALGATLLADRGTPVYSDPITSIIKETRWHNALTVEAEDGSELSQLNPCPAAIRPAGTGDDRELHLSAELTPAWGAPVGSMTRTIESPEPLRLAVRDRVELSVPRRVVFHLHSHHPLTLEGPQAALVSAPTCRLRVSWRWEGEVVCAGLDLTDGEGRPVHHLAVRSTEASRHDLSTDLEILPAP